MNMHGHTLDNHPEASAATPSSWRRLAIIATLLFLGGVAACIADVPVARLTVNNRHDAFAISDFSRFLRAGGYLPVWLVVGAALIAERQGKARAVRGVMRSPGAWLIASTILAGVCAEAMKLLVRRKRLTRDINWYDFRPFDQNTFDTGGLSLPSSHVIIAFAAAFALGRAYPATRWILIPLAVGTAFSRVQMGAHYVSDAYASALFAWPCAWCVCRLLRPAENAARVAPASGKPLRVKGMPTYAP